MTFLARVDLNFLGGKVGQTSHFLKIAQILDQKILRQGAKMRVEEL